jgi:hypothetical protein
MGQASAVPPEIDRWNWGAFLLNLFWGIGNNTWIALLMLLPVANWVMPFVLGAKGSAWAWRNKRWQSVEHFRRVQRRWAIVGLLLIGVWVLLIASTVALPVLMSRSAMQHPLRELAFATIRTSPEAVALLGSPIERADSSRGGASSSGRPGQMEVRFVISGPQGSAVVEARGRETKGGWELERVVVKPSSGGIPLVVLPRQRL